MTRKPKAEAEPELQDAYDENDRTISEDEAHRDAVYELPSALSQLFTVFSTQMKLFSRTSLIVVLAVLVILIPVVDIVCGKIGAPLAATASSNVYMSVCLTLFPIMAALICSMVCSKMIPEEFGYRTAYLSFPLPVSRMVFCLGKFLAGFAVAFAAITGAYGVAALTASFHTDSLFLSDLLLSYAVAAVTVFNYCAFTYMLSAGRKKGSTIIPFLLLFLGFPILMLIVHYLMRYLCGTDIITQDMFDTVNTYLCYIPVCGPDFANTLLGLGRAPMEFIPSFPMMFLELFDKPSISLFCAVSAILGILFLIKGCRAVIRRDL